MLINLKSVYYIYNQNLPSQETALKDVSFTIEANEIIALSGKSGSGKSTLGMVLSRLIKPTSGEIEFKPDVKVTYSPQYPEHSFFMDTVQAELEYSLNRQQVQPAIITPTIHLAATRLGLEPEKYFARHPQSLSGGEARRLGLALTAIYDADVFVFDEPTLALDRFGFDAIVDYLLMLKTEGKTIILITQDSDLIEQLANKLIILESGSIFWSGKWQEYFRSREWINHPLPPTENIINKLTN
jgi:energy-coupling factor transporter ATP-binding protein EcfA2